MRSPSRPASPFWNGGLALALLAAVAFSMSGPTAKFLGAAGLAPLEAVWLRMTTAGLVLVAVLAVVKPRALRIPRRMLPYFCLYAGIAVAGMQALFFLAITRLPVGVTLLIEYASPVLVVLWVRFVRKVRLPLAAFAGALVTVAGLAVVVEVWQGLGIDLLGLLFALGAGACCAGYFLLSDGFGDEMDPLGLVGWGLLGASVVLVPFARPWDIPWSVLGGTATVGDLTLPTLAPFAVLVLVATVLAYVTSITAVRRLSAAVGSTVASLEVISASIVAFVALGEALGPYQMVGGLIVLAGALIAQTATTRPGPVTAPPVPDPARAAV
ncbi:Threonine/homoserine efflux transporter RhtA [Sinosporangium album]|uniref:Threonine/homoserine efflux transporter RhtA n=1 Tax=Sinosporangium album TaxID=504805 RepID=A0A1G7Y6N3_9ACTN|nr:EamA family transporter [Sinosporangium album]SDG92084.1 Threonine/homoserine efflux transporter RhtA [Sinosporangium album]